MYTAESRQQSAAVAIALGEFNLLDDVGPGDWIVASLHPFARDVGSIVPPVFEAYARIFHSARLGETRVRWAEVAAANDRAMHPRVQFTKIALISGGYAHGHSQPGIWDQPPAVGCLDRDDAATVAATLRPFTETAGNCYFAFWEGWGGLLLRDYDVAKLPVPQRAMFLLQGALSAVPSR